VIKADGNLADLRVHTSSGFDVLDQAALDTVRQACPLHLKHELGRPEVVVSLPIAYSLSK
jgi:protein TonB